MVLKHAVSFLNSTPLVQKMNVTLHKEPWATIFYGIFWTTIFVLAIPVVTIYLYIMTLCRLVLYSMNRHSDAPLYDPKLKPDYDMAIVITGCDTGFGKDIAIYAADAGYTVFAGCYASSSLQQYATIAKVSPFVLDVTKETDITNCSKMINSWLQDTNIPVIDIGRKRVLHALVNNAGIISCSNIDWYDDSISDLQSMMNVNYFGIVRMVKALLPIFKEQAIQGVYGDNGGMRIINIVSSAGLCSSTPGMTGYTASKHAAQAFTAGLRVEIKPFQIAVVSVNPSFHRTPMVTAAESNMKDHIQKLSDTIQKQYGQAYIDTFYSLTKYCMVWDSNIVAEQVLEKCIKAKYPSREVLIGADAKYLFILFRILPTCIWEPIMQLALPTPECMIQNKNKTK